MTLGKDLLIGDLTRHIPYFPDAYEFESYSFLSLVNTIKHILSGHCTKSRASFQQWSCRVAFNTGSILWKRAITVQEPCT